MDTTWKLPIYILAHFIQITIQLIKKVHMNIWCRCSVPPKGPSSGTLDAKSAHVGHLKDIGSKWIYLAVIPFLLFVFEW